MSENVTITGDKGTVTLRAVVNSHTPSNPVVTFDNL